MNREILDVIIHPDKLSLPLRGVLVEAHFDDKAMTIIDSSIAARAGLSIAGLTDGAARDLPHFTPQQLRSVRRQEHLDSVRITGGTRAYGADLPDGELADYIDDSITFLDEIVRNEKPDFLIAPHPLDPHPDHRAAAKVAKIVADDEIALYYMDTIIGKDMDNKIILPTHYLPLTMREVRRRRRSYFANKSQVENLPPNELNDVFDVLRMATRRGKDVETRFAGAVIFEAPKNGRDPLFEIFNKNMIIFDRSDMSQE